MNELTKDVLSLIFNSAILIILLTVVYRAGLMVSTMKGIVKFQQEHEERSKLRWGEHDKEEEGYREGHQGQHTREGITRQN